MHKRTTKTYRLSPSSTAYMQHKVRNRENKSVYEE